MRSVVSTTRTPSTASMAAMIALPVLLAGGVDRDVAQQLCPRRPRPGRRPRSSRPPCRSRSRPARACPGDGRSRRGSSGCTARWAWCSSPEHAHCPRGVVAWGPWQPKAEHDELFLIDGNSPRLPGVLRAAGVDRHLDGLPDQRDLRLRLDAREAPHRVRRQADGRRLGRAARRGARRSPPTTRPPAARGRTCSRSSGRTSSRWSTPSATATSRVEGFEADDVIASHRRARERRRRAIG